MQFINPESFGVQYKSRYVPKPVEAVAAMTDTFNKRYEDAVASKDIVKQAAMAAQPATSAQHQELEKIAAEAQKGIDAAIESGDIRQVDLASKAIATTFASDPRVGIIAKAAEQVRKADETRIMDQLTTGARYFRNVKRAGDGSYELTGDENFLGYSIGEDGKIQAEQYVSPYVKGMDWVKTAGFNLTADENESLAIAAKAGDKQAQEILDASLTMMKVKRGGIPPDKIANIARQYSSVFLSTPEGQQYIDMVRSGQQAPPEGVNPEKMNDNELAATFLASVNAPQQFSRESVNYIMGGSGGRNPATSKTKKSRPANLEFINSVGSVFKKLSLEQAKAIRDGLKTSGKGVFDSRGFYSGVAAGYDDAGYAAQQAESLQLANMSPEEYEIAAALYAAMPKKPGESIAINSKEFQKYLKEIVNNPASFAVGIDEFEDKDPKAVRVTINENGNFARDEEGNLKYDEFDAFDNKGGFLSFGVLVPTDDPNNPKVSRTDITKWADGKQPVAIGHAQPGSPLSFWGGTVFSVDGKTAILEPPLSEQAQRFKESATNMMLNTVELAKNGGVPAITHKVGDITISTVAKKTDVMAVDPTTNQPINMWEVIYDENGKRQVFTFNPATGYLVENVSKRGSKPTNPFADAATDKKKVETKPTAAPKPAETPAVTPSKSASVEVPELVNLPKPAAPAKVKKVEKPTAVVPDLVNLPKPVQKAVASADTLPVSTPSGKEVVKNADSTAVAEIKKEAPVVVEVKKKAAEAKIAYPVIDAPASPESIIDKLVVDFQKQDADIETFKAKIHPVSLAINYLGLSETDTNGQAIIAKMFETTGVTTFGDKDITKDKTAATLDTFAWCAASVFSILKAVGAPELDKLIDDKNAYNRVRATGFMTVGQAVSSQEAAIGDIMIVTKPSSGSSHVALYAGKTEEGKVIMLGGNQNDSFNFMEADSTSKISYRRLPSIENLTEKDLAAFNAIMKEAGVIKPKSTR